MKPPSKRLEEGSKRIRALESLLSEKEEILKHNDEKMERLESELKEKRKELARHEIEVWQDIEKRELVETAAGKVWHFPQGLRPLSSAVLLLVELIQEAGFLNLINQAQVPVVLFT